MLPIYEQANWAQPHTIDKLRISIEEHIFCKYIDTLRILSTPSKNSSNFGLLLVIINGNVIVDD